jgi:hypothetical protein
MSRYQIPTLSAHHTCVVGYDPPLGTFFAQIEDITIPADDERHIVLWVGTEVQELATVAALIDALHGIVSLPAQIQAQLAHDQRTIGFRPNFGLGLVRVMSPHRPKEDDS